MTTTPFNPPPPRQFIPPREVFDPIQPIDLLSFAKQAASQKLADPELVRQFSAAVDELSSLFEKKNAPSRPPAPPTVCLADVPQRGVEWLWPGRVPIGKITLLVGDPGVGKSLIALDIAARVTRGAPFPDATCSNDSQPPALPGVFEPTRTAESNGVNQPTRATVDTNGATDADSIDTPNTAADPRQSRGLSGEHDIQSLNPEPPPLNPPSSVLLLSAEDDLADTVRPRLEALGADCTRIVALAAAEAPGQRKHETDRHPVPCPPSPVPSPFDLTRDVALLDRLLDSHPDCSLVIIDPISAYLGRAVENMNAEVRRIMTPLAELAERRRLAVVVVSHLRKQAGSAIHRSIGSLAFVAAARAAWLVTKDLKTGVNYTPERRLLLPIKNNIAADATGLACSIEPHPYAGEPIVRWSTEPLDADADAALMPAQSSAGRPAQDRDEAARWLQSQLADGPRPSAEVEESAVAHGFKTDTLRRAFRHLGGEAVRTGFGPQGKWHWRLPSIDRQNPGPNSAHLCTDPQKNHARPVC